MNRFALLTLALVGTATAQLWSSPKATLSQPLLRSFQPAGAAYRKGNATLELDTVAGRVVGVYAEAPFDSTGDLARVMVSAWGEDKDSVPDVLAALKDKSFQARARQGVIQAGSEDGLDFYALKLTGTGQQARWKMYVAINILPQSTFVYTTNVTGSASAPNKIHILSDFQCPACLSLWQETVPAWRSKPQQYQITYHHFPLSYHKNAFAAAEASECAARQGKFWPYADQLFGQFSAWNRKTPTEASELFVRFGKELGLQDSFRTCLSQHQPSAEVKRQMAGGKEVYLTGTPTVYLNGIKMTQFSSAEENAIRAVTLATPSAASVIASRLRAFR